MNCRSRIIKELTLWKGLKPPSKPVKMFISKAFRKGVACHCSGSRSQPTARMRVVTNDLTQDSTDETPKVCAVRWNIEQLHREAKQVTGLKSCQCRKAGIQRNHIAGALPVWCRFKELMYQTKRTVYQIKFGQLSDYLIQPLKNPSVKRCLA